MPEDDEVDEVGYGKPPKQNQFRKGASGNPSGRPKGKMNIRTKFRAIMDEKIFVSENGKSKSMTRFEALTRQMFNKAVSGDIRAMRETLKWAVLFDQGEESVPESSEERKRGDRLMETFLKGLQDDRGTVDPEPNQVNTPKGGQIDRPINVIPDNEE